MFRWFFIVVLLSGCAAQPEPPKVKPSGKPVKNVGIISTLGDSLLCTHTGLTVFSNEEQRYKLANTFNQRFTEQMSDAFSDINARITPLERKVIVFTDETQRASLWSNITFNNVDDVDTLVIFDGSFHYKSKEGFYASDNALNTHAKVYVYEVSTGSLLAEASQFKQDLKREFSCAQSSIPKNSDMLELLDQAVASTQKPLIAEVVDATKALQLK